MLNAKAQKILDEIKTNTRFKTDLVIWRKFRDAIKEDVRKLAQDDLMTDKSIANKLGVGQGIIQKTRTENGIQGAQSQRLAKQDEKIIELWGKHKDARVIMKLINRSYTATQANLARLSEAGRIDYRKPQPMLMANEDRHQQMQKSQAKLEEMFWKRVGPKMPGDAAYCIRRQVEQFRELRG